MKILILLVALVATSCAHVVPIVEDCSAEAAANLIDDVNTAIATADWRAGLAGLVTKFGVCVVRKTVEEVVAKGSVRAQYDSLEAAKLERARTWLAEHPAN